MKKKNLLTRILNKITKQEKPVMWAVIYRTPRGAIIRSEAGLTCEQANDVVASLRKSYDKDTIVWTEPVFPVK